MSKNNHTDKPFFIQLIQFALYCVVLAFAISFGIKYAFSGLKHESTRVEVSTDSIAITDVRLAPAGEDSSLRFLVKVTNKSKVTVNSITVAFRLYNAEGVLLDVIDERAEGLRELDPNESDTFAFGRNWKNNEDSPKVKSQISDIEAQVIDVSGRQK